jgi:hypothetical protein
MSAGKMKAARLEEADFILRDEGSIVLLTPHTDAARDWVNEHIGCAVKRRWSTAGVNPPGNWFAPPGSNQSSSGGNETAEASGVESR